MKKLFFGACIAFIALSISSCGTSSNGTSTVTEITITAGQWAASGTAGQPNFSYVHQHNMSSINQNILNNGYVLCYIKFNSTPAQYAPMPYVETYSSWTTTYFHQYTEGILYIARRDSDLNTIPPSGSVTVKIVVVSTKDAPLLDGVNTTDYVAVKQALQLAD